jgi:hypothetical protein
MCRTEKKGYIYQFLPKEFEYLTKISKIEYKEYKLKTDYLINIMHELILKFYFSENQDVKYNLWSCILKKKYGKIYNIYIQYLVEYKFMNYVSNYYVGKKSKSYKLNITSLNIIRYKSSDKILLKKYKKDYLYRTFTAKQESSIPLELRKLLIDDLYHIKIDYDKAFNWLKKAKKSKEIILNKYMKNLSSIDSIDTGHIFFKFDSFGRLHTNFTVLKKYIRQNCLSIDGDSIFEIDIANSQPFFFAVYLKDEIGIENFNDEVKKYVDCVKNGLIYDEFLYKFPKELKCRNDAKIMMYKILFGNNIDNKKESKMFMSLYPTVYNYIKEYKYLSESYKSLSHELQKLESNFIFNKVIHEIKLKFPQIRLFTIHDSIIFPLKYKTEVELIFNYHFRNLLN